MRSKLQWLSFALIGPSNSLGTDAITSLISAIYDDRSMIRFDVIRTLYKIDDSRAKEALVASLKKYNKPIDNLKSLHELGDGAIDILG